MRYFFVVLSLVSLLFADIEPKKSYLDSENIWITTYKNHKDFQSLEEQMALVNKKIAQAKRGGKSTLNLEEELAILEAKYKLFDVLPRSFVDLLNISMPNIEQFEPTLLGFMTKSYFREFRNANERLRNLKSSYDQAVLYLDEYEKELISSEVSTKNELLLQVENDKRYFEIAADLLVQKSITLDRLKRLYENKIDHYKNHDLVQHAISFAFLVAVVLLLMLIRRMIFRFVADEEQALFWKKSVTLVAVLMLVLFFVSSYIENLLYALTLIGFVAAALTIVMKEAILNIAAGIYLLFGSSIRVGDRILYQDGQSVIGDVISISIFRITLYEEITHNSAVELKRAGRIIFVPTSFVFTKTIYNYTHDTIKTIYDLIEMPISVDSNLEKAREIATNIVENASQRYIQMARKQYMVLRETYTIRAKNLRPKVQFMFCSSKQSLVMYIWFVSPYREILDFRSEVTLELIARLKNEEDIKILTKA